MTLFIKFVFDNCSYFDYYFYRDRTEGSCYNLSFNMGCLKFTCICKMLAWLSVPCGFVTFVVLLINLCLRFEAIRSLLTWL